MLTLFQASRGRWPEAPALVSGRGELTYEALGRAAERTSRALLDRSGEGAGKAAAEKTGAERPIVAILAEDAGAVATAVLASLAAGRAFAPFDVRTPDARLTDLFAELRPVAVLAEEAWRERAEAALPADLPIPVQIPIQALDTDGREPERPLPDPAWRPDDLAYVYFTSGSTGRPKAIAGRLKGIDHFVRWEVDTLGLSAGCRVSQLTTPSFDALLRDLFTPWSCGGVACAPPSRQEVSSPHGFAGWLREARIEVLHTVPSVFRLLLDPALDPPPLDTLRYVLLAGERLLPSDVGRFHDRYGESATLVNLYGPSETTMTKLFHVVRPEDRKRRSVPIGRPMRGARAAILDETGLACKPGVRGEIYIRTPYRSLGYLRRPDLTREVFVPNPLGSDPDDLVYRTGDFGRLTPSGDLEFEGRGDDQVKIRGVRVEPGEVEAALTRDPRVREAVVMAREDEAGDPALVAWVVADGAITSRELREICAGRLPDAMVPRFFVPLSELPRRINGKVDRQRLPAPKAAEPTEALSAPRTLVAQMVEEMWREVLEVDRVGHDADFFELGGHSLLVNRFLARVRSALGVEVEPADFFAHPTLGGIAERVEALVAAGSTVRLPPLRAVGATEAPLSFGQERLWVLHRLDPLGSAYNMPSALAVEGPLDPAALAAALDGLTRRHQVLRSRYVERAGRPVQVVDPSAGRVLGVVDLRGVPEARRQGEAVRLVRRDAKRPFDLARGPVLRCLLFRLGAERHVLYLNLHHIGGDVWSMSLLVRETLMVYRAAVAGEPSPLPEPEVQYADFAAWQREALSGERLKRLIGFWRDRLGGAPAALELPTDRPRPPMQTYAGAGHRLELDPELTGRLRALGRGQGATLFTVLLAAFQILLHRVSGVDDVSVGVPVAGRDPLETERLVGFFVNTLVIRSRLPDRPRFEDYLVRLRDELLAAHAHQALPFEKLVEEVQPRRSLRHAPLFQVLFVLQNAPRADVAVPGLAVRSLELGSTGAKFDLSLALIEEGGGLRGSLEYNTDLFDRTTVVRLARSLRALLAAAVARPGDSVAELPLLGAGERAQLIREWNDTGVAPPEHPTLFRAFVAQAGRTPDLVAARCGGEIVRYRELLDRANRLANRLVELGVRPGSLVGVGLERGIDMLASLLAVQAAGGAYVPLDPAYPRARLAQMLEDSDARVLITQEALLDVWPEHAGILCVDREADAIARRSAEAPAVDIGPDDLAYVIYTSGSTGRPKGVEVRHGALVNLLASLVDEVGLTAEDRLLAITSLSFDIAGLELYAPLLRGAEVEIVESGRGWDGGWLAGRLADPEVTIAQATPSGWRLILESGLDRVPGLRVLCGGEALDPTLAADLTARAGGGAWNVYGPTETTIWSTCWRIPESPGPRVSIGRPLAETSIHVVDAAGGPVPVGVAGELSIGGVGLARGYHDAPRLTAERFVPDPFGERPGGRLYRTGDLARRGRAGALECLGRLDRQVKVRGYRIELGEVEAALGAHPAVREAAAVVRLDPGGAPLLAAFFTAAGEEAPSDGDLRRFLAGRLPEHMVPGRLARLDELPLTPNGKIDRKALPGLDTARPDVEAAYRAPGSQAERELAAIWRDVLGIEKVGVRDNFFDLGGHSLALVRVHGLLTGEPRPWLERPPSLIELFMYPTIAALVGLVSGRGESIGATDEERIRERRAGRDRARSRRELRRRARR